MGSTKPVLVVIDEIDGATGDNVRITPRAGIFLSETSDCRAAQVLVSLIN